MIQGWNQRMRLQEPLRYLSTSVQGCLVSEGHGCRRASELEYEPVTSSASKE